MLDLFNVKLPAGFPDHPHRGFETVTYMLSGEISHEDFKGHRGVIGPGDIQWMTAGKGIVHSEIPMSFTEPAYGFQLWINLDKKNKFCDPKYQEFKASEIPVYKDDSMTAKVISGEVFGVKGPIVARVPTYFLDFYMNKDKTYEHPIPKGWNSMIIVHSGSFEIQDSGKILNKGDCASFSTSDSEEQFIKVKALTDNSAFVLLAGQPLNEPISNRGPFVLNTPDELR